MDLFRNLLNGVLKVVNSANQRDAKSPRPAYDHDWMIKGRGKIAPYGGYNLNNNTVFVILQETGRDNFLSIFKPSLT